MWHRWGRPPTDRRRPSDRNHRKWHIRATSDRDDFVYIQGTCWSKFKNSFESSDEPRSACCDLIHRDVGSPVRYCEDICCWWWFKYLRWCKSWRSEFFLIISCDIWTPLGSLCAIVIVVMELRNTIPSHTIMRKLLRVWLRKLQIYARTLRADDNLG